MYIALLRGIGPGNPNMTNAKLKEVFTGLGYHGVQSVISSGNIIFQSDESDTGRLEHTIQQALHQQLGIPGGTIVRSKQQLTDIMAMNPFGGQQHGPESYQLVTFLKQPSDVRFPGNDAVYQSADCVCTSTDTTAVKTPDIMRRLEKVYGKDITSRTYLTVERILKKMQQ